MYIDLHADVTCRLMLDVLRRPSSTPPPAAGHDVAGQGLHFDLHWQGLQSRPWRP